MMRRLDIDIDWLPVDDTVRHVSPNHLSHSRSVAAGRA